MEQKTVKIEILKNGLLRIERLAEQDREGFQLLLKEMSNKSDMSDLDVFLAGIEDIELLYGEKTFCG